MYNTIYGLILTAAAINGFGASILWVAGLKYLSECANDDNKGTYNSIFWGFFMCSQVVGNLMGAFLLVSFSEVLFFVVLSGFCALAALLFLTLKTP
jgi:hypothetical protein